MKKIHLPSWDHVGKMSLDDSEVNGRGVPPSDAIAKISLLPAGRESNAIHFPSGDHLGVPVGGPPNVVNCKRWPPLLSETQISSLPVRFEAKAMRCPSGEKTGLLSSRED